MEIQIKKWGNSAGLPLSKPLLQQLNVTQGDCLEAEVKDGVLIMRPIAKPQYTLDELLASCTPENTRIDDEDQAWLQDSPAGREMD